MTQIIKKEVDIEKFKKKYLNLEFDFSPVCEKIRVLRRTNMLDQQAMCEYLGYSRAAYSNNERNSFSSFDLTKLLKIKKLFGLTWSELLGESEIASVEVESLLKINNLEAKLKEKEMVIDDLSKRLADKDRIIALIDKKERG